MALRIRLIGASGAHIHDSDFGHYASGSSLQLTRLTGAVVRYRARSLSGTFRQYYVVVLCA